LSTLTKVFIVLLSIFGIAFSMMTISVASQTTNWREVATSNEANARIAETNLRNAVAAGNAALAMAEDKVNEQMKLNGQLQEQLEALRRDVATLKAESAQADAERVNSEAINRGLVSQLQMAQTTGEEFRKQRDELETRSVELERRNMDLSNRVNELTARVAVLVEQGRQSEQQLNILKKENQALSSAAARGGSGGTMESAAGSALPGVTGESPVARSTIRGKVLEVSGNLVTISVGSADGVEKGMVFVVHRGGTYVGDVKISIVDPNQAVGRLIESAVAPSPEDEVTDAVSLTAARG
jgi:hypothetical protein